jgi:hypothetical protein
VAGLTRDKTRTPGKAPATGDKLRRCYLKITPSSRPYR